MTAGRDAVPGGRRRPAAFDGRRSLHLLLALIWLFDGVLQLQPFMFTRDFGSRMLAGGASGNPGWIAHSITWAAGIVTHHPVWTNGCFAAIQIALGLGIAWRPTLRAALAASVGWSLAVWWLGEGVGGVLTGGADPVTGAPGAVILYALLAVLLWPPSDAEGRAADSPVRCVAERPIGAVAARSLWLLLWGSLAYFAVLPANRTPQGPHDLIAGSVSGQPPWLAAVLRWAAGLVAHRGVGVSIGLAVLLAVVAAGVLLPAPAARAALVLAFVAAGVIWLVGQALGDPFSGQATDPNSGPLLALLAAAYWPRRRPDPALAPAGPSAATA